MHFSFDNEYTGNWVLTRWREVLRLTGAADDHCASSRRPDEPGPINRGSISGAAARITMGSLQVQRSQARAGGVGPEPATLSLEALREGYVRLPS
jgi:hypothetical protein